MITQQEIIDHYGDIDPDAAEAIANNATSAGIQNMEEFQKALDAAGEVMKRMVLAMRNVVKAIKGYSAAVSVATPKELHFLRHAKRARTRKKYMNRLIRRYKKTHKGGKP